MSKHDTDQPVIRAEAIDAKFQVAHAANAPTIETPERVALSPEESQELYDIMMELEYKGG